MGSALHGAVVLFYSHVNYSVTKINSLAVGALAWFYSHVNYSVTKITPIKGDSIFGFTVT